MFMLRIGAYTGAIFCFIVGLFGIVLSYQFGSLNVEGDEKYTYMYGLATLDVVKMLLAFVLLRTISRTNWVGSLFRCSIGTFFILILSFISFNASMGLYEIIKEKRLGGIKATKVSYEQLTLDKTNHDKELLRLRAITPKEIIEGELTGKRAHKRWKSTRGCTPSHITRDLSRNFCEEYRTLEGKVAAAIPIAKINTAIDKHEAGLSKASSELKKLNLVTVTMKADPAIKSISNFWGITEERARYLFAASIGIAVEIAAAFGSVLFLGGEFPTSRRRRSAALAKPTEQTERSPIILRTSDYSEEEYTPSELEVWARENLVRRKSCYVPSRELYPVYVSHCQAQGIEPLNKNAFGREMNLLNYQSKKIGGVQKYVDVAMAMTQGAPQLRLVANS